MERLDKNLLDHAAAVGTREGGPDITGVYQLGALAERHYYMKAEHPFSPDEVEALLQFVDPLEVAQACWEESSHPYSFPICELLEEINARGHFALVEPLSASERQAHRDALMQRLKTVMKQNLADYHSDLMNLDKQEIIGKSAEIVAVQEAYDYMTQDFPVTERDAKILLTMENPLQFIVQTWPSGISELVPMADHIAEAIEEAGSNLIFSQKAELPASPRASVRGQLRNAAQEASQRPAQDAVKRFDEPR